MEKPGKKEREKEREREEAPGVRKLKRGEEKNARQCRARTVRPERGRGGITRENSEQPG